jgi:hypothetical protein
MNHTANTSRPEFFSLPAKGRDPYFSLSRSAYYDLERRGLLRFRRLRKPGNIRGRVLISYDEMRALVDRLGVQGVNPSSQQPNA